MIYPIIYCLNTFENHDKLKITINYVNEMIFPRHIFVSYNAEEPKDLPNNVTTKYFGPNQGWQLGALNGVIQSLRMAAEEVVDLEKYTVIFSHDDIFPVNINKILMLCKQLVKVDYVAREYVGTGGNKDHSIPYKYLMLEDIIFRGSVVKDKFLGYPIINELVNNCAEYTFGKIMNDYTGLLFPIEKNVELIENEMGFFHNHKH